MFYFDPLPSFRGVLQILSLPFSIFPGLIKRFENRRYCIALISLSRDLGTGNLSSWNWRSQAKACSAGSLEPLVEGVDHFCYLGSVYCGSLSSVVLICSSVIGHNLRVSFATTEPRIYQTLNRYASAAVLRHAFPKVHIRCYVNWRAF